MYVHVYFMKYNQIKSIPLCPWNKPAESSNWFSLLNLNEFIQGPRPTRLRRAAIGGEFIIILLYFIQLNPSCGASQTGLQKAAIGGEFLFLFLLNPSRSARQTSCGEQRLVENLFSILI
jgi:hypothetical protein